MVASAVHTRPRVVAISYESTAGQPPGYNRSSAPGGTAAQWASDEGSTVDRIWCIEAEPSWVKQKTVEDPNMVDLLLEQNTHLKGVRNADDGSMVLKLTGTGAETGATSQVSETALGKLLGHMLGGSKRTYSSALTAATSATAVELTTSTGLDEGDVLFFEEDSTDRCFARRVLTVSSGEITLDSALPFTPDTSDDVQGSELAFLDPDALSNPSDANASTVSVLIEQAGQRWVASGARVCLDSISFERDDVPRLECSVMAARANPPGDGAPSAITWTGTVQGEAGLVVGTDTKLLIQDVGTTTVNCVDIESASLTTGITCTPLDTLTECDDGMPGRAGYTVEVGESIFEVTAYLDTGWQDDFDANTAKYLHFSQVGAPGSCWDVAMPNAVLLSPEFSEGNNQAGMYTLRFLLKPDRTLDSTASDVNLARSRFVIARG